jgi:uncharacterized protein YprB with RNaseH-like and TPR domain
VSFADRVRGVIAGPHPPARPVIDPAPPQPADSHLACLGGEWLGRDRSCFVVERRRDAHSRHGRESIGHLAERLSRYADEAAMLSGTARARAPFVFFDLETTGLSGGAGTYAFLVGCGWFDDGTFMTRQFLLTRFADERPMLDAVAGELSRAGALVSFNGKSFDVPVLETRYLFHRLAWVAADVPHVDVLHPARRFWRKPASAETNCSLTTLEGAILGARRTGDVPGHEIPERYFRFVRSGDPRPLAAVLEHNRLDLLTLAGLTARLLELLRSGPDAASTAREALALGHLYGRAGIDSRAREAFQRAVGLSRAPGGAFDPVKLDALRALALSLRHARAFDEAAACWQQILNVRGCPPVLARDATEALAIHHEHRVRDLTAATGYALRTLEEGGGPARTDAARHRLARLQRKMEKVGRTESLKFEV